MHNSGLWNLHAWYLHFAHFIVYSLFIPSIFSHCGFIVSNSVCPTQTEQTEQTVVRNFEKCVNKITDTLDRPGLAIDNCNRLRGYTIWDHAAQTGTHINMAARKRVHTLSTCASYSVLSSKRIFFSLKHFCTWKFVSSGDSLHSYHDS